MNVKDFETVAGERSVGGRRGKDRRSDAVAFLCRAKRHGNSHAVACLQC